jgi:AcrR family transcriptional regulator
MTKRNAKTDAGAAPGDRAPLSRERALAAAVAIADTEGIESLSMRRLARELGVEAMSLYHHLAGKEELLDGMIDRVFGEIQLPFQDRPWKDAMRERALSVRATLTRHPWAISLMVSRKAPGPHTLRHHDAVLGACRRAGFSVPMAAHAFSLIDSYIFGFVLQELNLPFNENDAMAAKVNEIVPAHALAAFPHLAELTVEHVLKPGYRYGDEFEFGLKLILEGLEAAAKPAPRQRR